VLFCFSVAGLLAGAADAQVQSSSGSATAGGRSPEEQVVIKAVQQSNPQTAQELATALATMLNLEAIEEARFYLERLRGLVGTDQQKFELYDAIGANLFFDLQFNEALAPTGVEFARDVVAAARRVAGSSERIEQLIARLSNPDLSTRNESLRALRSLGPRATAEILAVFSDFERQSEFPFLRSALAVMGEDAIGPLLAGARSNHLLVQGESVRALSHYRTPEAADVMMRTYLSPRIPAPLRQIALTALTEQNRLPIDPNSVENRFYDRAYSLLTRQQSSLPTLLDETELWHWNDQQRALMASRVPSVLADQWLAAQLAADLYEINPQEPRNRELRLLTQLEFEKRQLDSSLQLGIGHPLTSAKEEASRQDLEQVLATALKLELIPAATVTCQLLGQQAQPAADSISTVPPEVLIDAVRSGDRHLQFAALEAIIKLDPTQAYPGSSLVLSLAVFLAASEGQDVALIGDNFRDFAQSYAATLSLSGVKGISAVTGKELFATAISNPDVRAIMVTDSLTRPYATDLIEMLRRDLRTKKLPIGLLVRDAKVPFAIERMAAVDPLLTLLPLTIEPEQVVSQIRRVKQTLEPWTVEGQDRKRHAAVALDWLAKIAADRQTYRFYDLGNHQQELAKTIYIPNSIEPATVILQNLGTPAAQKELLNFISQNSFPIEDRRRAVAAFAALIQTSGTLLTREEILQQYARYNASEGEPQEVQELLANVLDALEANSRR
jgi:hypothetical protein